MLWRGSGRPDDGPQEGHEVLHSLYLQDSRFDPPAKLLNILGNEVSTCGEKRVIFYTSRPCKGIKEMVRRIARKKYQVFLGARYFRIELPDKEVRRKRGPPMGQ